MQILWKEDYIRFFYQISFLLAPARHRAPLRRGGHGIFDKTSLFDGASIGIGGMELCVKGKVLQDLVCEIHKVIERLVGDHDG